MCFFPFCFQILPVRVVTKQRQTQKERKSPSAFGRVELVADDSPEPDRWVHWPITALLLEPLMWLHVSVLPLGADRFLLYFVGGSYNFSAFATVSLFAVPHSRLIFVALQRRELISDTCTNKTCTVSLQFCNDLQIARTHKKTAI